ncbi:formimidoylglutamase [Mammaliicoccus sciuri]|uniref:formimidoylglutamase n=1 Tax=Mammaliicoccus sciuri TaxID=1296 RepID=UPI000BD6EB5B|nr:formimidoylglutamase [Mammaliicoccus sciuri]PCQ19838.1 formimidoylglutamase [Klebsiella pneumoniae]MEB8265622.1 formimidoylglutamase [Mammaliicoccus sciuri]MEB8374091.1 formimidoylglutamase [Mammaliicoccus sciuri]PTJ99973.1 formimidoylglutamase [Mammaliicoccus sciuri]RIN97279.1 formimidoylglutamase [Mammaliicoccus sciuri]
MYRNVKKDEWTGRTDSTTLRSAFRFHQIVDSIHIEKEDITPKKEFESQVNMALIGFECDEGVSRNNGRPGAVDGPKHFRKALSPLPIHNEYLHLTDYGDIICHKNKMEEAQSELGDKISNILLHNDFTVIIGGGHEVLYGHYLGVRKANKDKKIGIINIDAHFDMRDYDEKPSSGTMFKQILDQDDQVGYFVLGIQKNGNTKALFERADEYGVQYIREDELRSHLSIETITSINSFIEGYDEILITLCTDSIDVSYAPAVSAPCIMGLQPQIVQTILQLVTNSNKSSSISIAELSPRFDIDNRTARLLANIASNIYHDQAEVIQSQWES